MRSIEWTIYLPTFLVICFTLGMHNILGVYNTASARKKLGAKTTQVNIHVHMATVDRDRQGKSTQGVMCSGGSQHTQLILTFWLLYFVTSSCAHDFLTSASQRGVLTVVRE